MPLFYDRIVCQEYNLISLGHLYLIMESKVPLSLSRQSTAKGIDNNESTEHSRQMNAKSMMKHGIMEALLDDGNP